MVGSNDTTAAVIDASYRRFLAAMENHLGNQPYLLGNRPAAGDFGLFGQLCQLVGFDPTPRAIAHDVSPRTVAWVDLMRDQCGLEPTEQDWVSLAEQPASLRGLLQEIGRMYAPAQLANVTRCARPAKKPGKRSSMAPPGPSRPSPTRPSACAGPTNATGPLANLTVPVLTHSSRAPASRPCSRQNNLLQRCHSTLS